MQKMIMDPSSIWIPANTLVLLCGVSSSGKTTFCKENFPNKLVVCTDDILLDMARSYPDESYFGINSRVQDYITNKIISLGWCYKSTVIIDAIGISNKRRLVTIEKYSSCFSSIIQIVIQPDLEIILKRTKKEPALELKNLNLYYPNQHTITRFWHIIQENINNSSITKGTDHTYILHDTTNVSIIY